MALTKDKLVTRLQTQIGIGKQESRQIVERLFAIMKGTLADGEECYSSLVSEPSWSNRRMHGGAETLRTKKL